VEYGFSTRCCATEKARHFGCHSQSHCGGKSQLYARSAGPTWNLSVAPIRSIDQLEHPAELKFMLKTSIQGMDKAGKQGRLGWVPDLNVQAVHNRLRHPLPCSNSRGEDAALARTFFTHWRTGHPLSSALVGRRATFLEIGGADGMMETNTWVFERCLGWRGILVEGHPKNFAELSGNRPGTINLQMAVCKQSGWVNFTSFSGAWTKIESSASKLQVQCGPLGARLQQLGVLAIDLFVLDVEGAELLVLDTLELHASRISVGVLCIEVRGDGIRGLIMRRLLGAGFVYVGELRGRPTVVNDVVDDIYYSPRHMQEHWPESQAAQLVPSE